MEVPLPESLGRYETTIGLWLWYVLHFFIIPITDGDKIRTSWHLFSHFFPHSVIDCEFHVYREPTYLQRVNKFSNIFHKVDSKAIPSQSSPVRPKDSIMGWERERATDKPKPGTSALNFLLLIQTPSSFLRTKFTFPMQRRLTVGGSITACLVSNLQIRTQLLH